jgi:hypothetical protein
MSALRRALKRDGILAPHVHPGKQALTPTDRAAILESRFRVEDSLNLDGATKTAHPDEHRWDYVLGTSHPERPILAVEVHPARNGEVDVLIQKKRAAETMLASELTAKHRVRRWLWIASGRSSFTGTGPEARRLAAAGIRFVGGRLNLDRDG